MPRTEIADAYALGQVFADMREGDFIGLNTNPPPTEENVKRCLGQIPTLAQSQVVRKVFALIDGGPPPPPPLPPSPPPPPPVIDAVRKVMQSARWLVFERLHRQLITLHRLEVTPEELRDAIAAAPLREELLCYPLDIRMSADISHSHLVRGVETC